MIKSKQDVTAWLENNRQVFIEMSDSIWEYAEPAWKEFRISPNSRPNFWQLKGSTSPGTWQA